jgi:hypothetical protein
VKTTTIACDRCSATIDGTFSILEVRHGDLVRQFDAPLDLCSVCSGDLADFLKPTPFKLESSHEGVGASHAAPGCTIGELSTI